MEWFLYGSFSALAGSTGSLSESSLVDLSTESELVGEFTGTVNSAVSITQNFSFDPTDQYFTSSVTVTNVSDADLSDLLFMRSSIPIILSIRVGVIRLSTLLIRLLRLVMIR